MQPYHSGPLGVLNVAMVHFNAIKFTFKQSWGLLIIMFIIQTHFICSDKAAVFMMYDQLLSPQKCH